MAILKKEDILKRAGWSENNFACFLPKSNFKKTEAWHLNFIENIEKTEEFKNFTTVQDFKEKLKTTLKKEGLINKEQVLKRGWSEDSIGCLAGNSHMKYNQECWHFSRILKIEKTEEFKTFTNAKDFRENRKLKREQLITKEEIAQRGWSEEQLEYFTRKIHARNAKNEPAWEKFYIENVEKTLTFKNFKNKEELNQRTDIVERSLQLQNEAGIERIKNLVVEFEKHDCLIKHKHDYDNFKPIFHLVKKDFTPDENGSYSLFTDGCFKSIGRNAFASCAGWVLDNKTNEIVVEFTKTVELNENLTNGMPEFELIGISEGVKIIKQLGLKNVQCFTDSAGEAKTILSALNGIGDSRFTKNMDLYVPLTETLKKSNSTIGWIPREYNLHADELTKIPLNAWINHYKKIYLEHDYIKETGYVVNRDKEIYFHQNKVECIESQESNSPFILVMLKPEKEDREKLASIVLYNTENKSIQLLDKRDFKIFDIDETLPEEDKRVKKSKPDAAYIKHISNILDNFKEINNLEIGLSVPPGVFAVMKKLIPIPPMLQEEYFEFHQSLEKFKGQLTVNVTDPKILKEIKKVLSDTYGEKKLRI